MTITYYDPKTDVVTSGPHEGEKLQTGHPLADLKCKHCGNAYRSHRSIHMATPSACHDVGGGWSETNVYEHGHLHSIHFKPQDVESAFNKCGKCDELVESSVATQAALANTLKEVVAERDEKIEKLEQQLKGLKDLEKLQRQIPCRHKTMEPIKRGVGTGILWTKCKRCGYEKGRFETCLPMGRLGDFVSFTPGHKFERDRKIHVQGEED